MLQLSKYCLKCSVVKKKFFSFHYYDYYIEYTIDPMKPEPFKFYMHMDIVEMNLYS